MGSRRTPVQKEGATQCRILNLSNPTVPECDPADATPLDAALWQRLLVGHPDRDFASYISCGLTRWAQKVHAAASEVMTADLYGRSSTPYP